MAFNIKINACIVGKETKLIKEYSNCSSIKLEKIDIYDERSFSNGVLVNNLYKIKFIANPTSTCETTDIRKTYFDGSKIYFLTKIYAYNTDTDTMTLGSENLINKFDEVLALETNTELRCFYEDKIPVCVTADNKYHGDPFILYGNESNDTQKVKEISINNDCEKFWICENKTSYESVDFTMWQIHIHEVAFKSNNSFSDNIYATGTIQKGDSKLLNLATVTFNLDVNNSDIDLYLVRNENVLSLKNLKKLSIYNTTFTSCINPAKITERLKALQSEDKTIESIGYYLEAEACYEPKNVHITVWRRNNKPIYTLEYKFATDISDKSITVPKRGGHVFDGFYINPKVENNDLDKVPGNDETLNSNHVRVTDKSGKFLRTLNGKDYCAENFLDKGIYINPVDYKYVKANYEKARTTVTLDWQINGKGYTKNGKEFSDSELDKTRVIKFNDPVSKHKITDIPTDLKVNKNGVDVKLKFMGFYSSGGSKVINEEGNFRTDLINYTSAGNWRWNKDKTEHDNITLCAYWASGSYIDLQKVGGTGGSDSFTVEYGEDMDNHKLTPPVRYIDPSDETSDKLIFNGYWIDDYKTRVTKDNGVFKASVKNQHGTKITNASRKWLLQEPITLYAYWYSDRYTVYANSNIDACTAKVNNKNKVNKKTSEKVTLTASYDKLRYNFNGWYVNDNRFSTNETVERTILTSDVNSAENRIDYNANFEDRKYTIYYKDLDNYQYGKHTFYYDSYVKNLLKPSKAGYKFVGWFIDRKLTNQITYINEGDGSKDVVKTNLTSKGTVQEITLYAKWEKITIEGRFILKPGDGKWNKTQPPVTGTTVVYGNKMPEINADLIPVLEGYSFLGFYDKDWHQVIDKECTDWKKNTRYVDEDGNSIMTDTHEFTAKFSKDIDFDEGLNKFIKSLNCNITAHSNVDFKNSIENKIATIDWINTAIGIPEVNYYDDLIKNFYNNDIEDSYNSNKCMADKYFFNDFDIDDNRLLKQSDIIEFFDTSATELKNNFYLKDITYDPLNNKTIMRINFIEKNKPSYPAGYSGSKDTIIYFTINDDKSVVYKMCIDEINYSGQVETYLQYFDIEFPYLTDYINKITIEHISCFAIDNLDNTRTYYKPYLVFNKLNTLNLTIEENTLLNNTEIKEYNSDNLMIPVYPGGGGIS
jgi:uncharacterized repeat protein (TIGR02543 family)